MLALDGFTTDQGDPKASDEIVSSLDVMVGQDWILV